MPKSSIYSLKRTYFSPLLAINSGFYFTWVNRKDQNDKDGQGYNWVVEHMLGTRQALASTSRGKGTTHQNKQANQQKTQQKLFWKKKKREQLSWRYQRRNQFINSNPKDSEPKSPQTDLRSHSIKFIRFHDSEEGEKYQTEPIDSVAFV